MNVTQLRKFLKDRRIFLRVAIARTGHGVIHFHNVEVSRAAALRLLKGCDGHLEAIASVDETGGIVRIGAPR